METDKKNGWGGKREGAGRKKGCAKRYMFSATQDVVDILEALDSKKSDFICQAIRQLAAQQQS
ncbi:MAG: hypothetical protein IJ775_05025 [Muribaculaceae bacterium]|nr:hypothetical protein [Muribaculaceae bacterium]